MPIFKKLKLKHTALKKQMRSMFMSIGLILGMTLTMLQLYVNYSSQTESHSNNFSYALEKTIQPLTEAILPMSFTLLRLAPL